MLNTEIGTYPIVAALDVKKNLPIKQLNATQVEAKFNGQTHVGNLAVIESMFPKLNFQEELVNVDLERKRTAVQVLDEDFDIRTDADWYKLMEDPKAVWAEAMARATKENKTNKKKKTKGVFSFDEADSVNFE
jgi:hypothetical protein